MTDAIRSDESATARYSVAGMDCASCVAQIEAAARQVPGVDDVKVSVATQTMTVNVRDAAAQLTAVERAVAAIGHPLNRIDDTTEESDGDDLARDLRHTTLGYKRALWIVVVLNVGYGLVEIVAGFVARSQALQADSLDFLGRWTDLLARIAGHQLATRLAGEIRVDPRVFPRRSGALRPRRHYLPRICLE